MLLDEYCSQTVKDVRQITGCPYEMATTKGELLSLAAKFYYQKRKIDLDVYKVLQDPRCIRLCDTKVKFLKKLLAERNIVAPKQGKGKIIQLCYDNGIDVETDSSDQQMIGESFVMKDGHLYFMADEKLYPITNKILLHLFTLLLER